MVEYGVDGGQAPQREWDPVAAQDDLYSRVERLEGQVLDDPSPIPKQTFRIEALRAAAQVVAAASGWEKPVSEVLIEVAAPIAQWLETGER